MRDTLKAVIGYSLLFSTVSVALLLARGHAPLTFSPLAQASADSAATSSMSHGEMRRAVSLSIRH
jgi:hypothetical protein